MNASVRSIQGVRRFWIGQLDRNSVWCCGQDRSPALKGRNTRKAPSMPQSSIKNPPPSGFHAVRCGVKTRTPRTAMRRVTQGGVSRLGRCALPWADLLRPFGEKTSRAFWASRRDPAFCTPQRDIHRIAQGRASGEAAKRRPGLIGPRLANLCSGAKFSGAAQREPFDAKKKLLPEQILNGPGCASCQLPCTDRSRKRRVDRVGSIPSRHSSTIGGERPG